MAADPPAVTRDPDLAARLEAAWAERGPGYVPRTDLHDAEGRAKYVNRLILEASPYLVQHAHNPVDWRPWGAEAFAEAERRGVPVFLSVGYATCHWCHVMEEESFDDEEVAEALNAGFVAIKLDREARPDIDHTYITATQLQNGHAGWPNSVFLRPDGAPFHTGTYFPKAQFLQLLAAVSRAWAGNRDEIDGVAEKLSGAIRRQQAATMPDRPAPDAATFEAALAQLGKLHNDFEGGFSEQQQFPQEGFLLYLLDHWRRTGEAQALEIATRTLDAIAAGGIHDHVGGGFHRYTVDPNWRTPHFEKMLYNQGLLAQAFVEGWEATARPDYARAALRCFDYLARDMTDPDGAFYAAEDADSPDAEGRREEGAFYAWTPEAVRAALGDGPEAESAIAVLGIDQAPTIEAGAVAHLRPGTTTDFEGLDPVLDRLREARDARARPIRDEKVIAGWNGLAIRALAEAARAFDRPDLAGRAARAAEAVWARLWDGTRLARLHAGGAAHEAGQLDDHAWLGLGFLALWEATGDPAWRDRAMTLAEAAVRDFGDGAGRLRMAAADGPLGPVYDSADGAVPAGESSALALLARLGREAGDVDMATRAGELRAAIAAQMVEMPLLRPDALRASRILDEGRSTLRRVLANGHLRAHLRPDAGLLVLDLAPGWHLNAADPGADWLVGAALEGGEADWPEGTALDLGFADAPVRVYEDRLAVPVRALGPQVTLHLQVCSDRVCLQPVAATFRVGG